METQKKRTTMEIYKATLCDLKQIGKKCETYDDLIRRRISCDAAGCEALGTNEIKVDAGKFGTVTLFVCPNCVGKFQE